MSDRNTASSKLEIVCPCCEATIVVDVSTGIVLHHTEKAAAGKPDSLGEILQGLAAKKESSEKLFQREMSSMKDRERILEEKMQEALRKVKENPNEKLVRPIDLE